MADILIRGMEMPKDTTKAEDACYIVEHEDPAADVRPVGIWIEIDDYVLCANCGVAEHSPNRNYCHSCGADMRKRS